MFDRKYDRSNGWINHVSKPYMRKTIKCSCGYDTGLNQDGFLMVIPREGLICPRCRVVIIQGTFDHRSFDDQNSSNQYCLNYIRANCLCV